MRFFISSLLFFSFSLVANQGGLLCFGREAQVEYRLSLQGRGAFSLNLTTYSGGIELDSAVGIILDVQEREDGFTNYFLEDNIHVTNRTFTFVLDRNNLEGHLLETTPGATQKRAYQLSCSRTK